jgi:hypothetical protein
MLRCEQSPDTPRSISALCARWHKQGQGGRANRWQKGAGREGMATHRPHQTARNAAGQGKSV